MDNNKFKNINDSINQNEQLLISCRYCIINNLVKNDIYNNNRRKITDLLYKIIGIGIRSRINLLLKEKVNNE